MRVLFPWFAIAISIFFVLAGCVTKPRPAVMVYPTEQQSATQVAQDKAHCRAWAEQEAGSTPVEDTLTDAGVGAAVGAVVGGLGGAGYAGTKAYASNDDAYNCAYAACMKARNYIVN